jgi:hypothetical protein
MPFLTRKHSEKKMIRMYDLDRKVPCKVVQSVIENKLYEFVVDSDSDLDKCLEAVCEIKDYLIKLKKDAEEIQAKKEENPIQD